VSARSEVRRESSVEQDGDAALSQGHGVRAVLIVRPDGNIGHIATRGFLGSARAAVRAMTPGTGRWPQGSSRRAERPWARLATQPMKDRGEMASINKEIVIEAGADDVWEVIGDFAAGPSRMAPGFVVDTRAEAGFRVVTFADGTVVRERCVDVDDASRRIVYSVVDGTVQPEHDNASMQVVADGERRCRLRWTRDLLPAELAAPMARAMSRGLEAVKRTLDGTGDPHPRETSSSARPSRRFG
jgi:hypothetical protein